MKFDLKSELKVLDTWTWLTGSWVKMWNPYLEGFKRNLSIKVISQQGFEVITT